MVCKGSEKPFKFFHVDGEAIAAQEVNGLALDLQPVST